jgi:hypothetical protein
MSTLYIIKILKAVAVIYNVLYFIFILHPAGIIPLPMILADAKIFWFFCILIYFVQGI